MQKKYPSRCLQHRPPLLAAHAGPAQPTLTVPSVAAAAKTLAGPRIFERPPPVAAVAAGAATSAIDVPRCVVCARTFVTPATLALHMVGVHDYLRELCDDITGRCRMPNCGFEVSGRDSKKLTTQ
jgi:hypothetical protein